jgi:CRP-like cAMP-binding protein
VDALALALLDEVTGSRNNVPIWAFASGHMLASEAGSILCRHGWLSWQPATFQRCWLARGELRHHPAGTLLHAEGEPPGDLCGLVQGDLAVTYSPKSGSSLLLHIARPGWWAGDAAAVSGGPRRASLATRSDSWVMHVGLPAIQAMAAEDPEVWRRVAQISIGHLDHAMSIIASLTVGDAPSRLASALCQLVDLDCHRAAGSVELQVSQKELGTLARISRNAIAPMLLKFERAGLIRRRYRRVEVIDVGALKAMVRRTRPTHIDSDAWRSWVECRPGVGTGDRR